MPCMVPSSPYGPCRTGKTTSTEARPAGSFSVVEADGHDFVTAAHPQRLRYGARGGQGHLVLPAAPPEDDHHPDQSAAPLFSSPPILAKGLPGVLFRPPAA